jgi:hypothetical protein
MFQRIVMHSSAGSSSLIKHNIITKIATSAESILAHRSEKLRAAVWPGFCHILPCLRGYALAQWLRHCATNWKVAGSILDGVIGIFH